MAKGKHFASEADLVAVFCDLITPKREGVVSRWTAYHETAGWDVLLVHDSDHQLGIEAKLSLNPKVLEQALPSMRYHATGPDYRAVLVPEDGLQHHMAEIARHLGLAVISISWHEGWGGASFNRTYYQMRPNELPDLDSSYSCMDWPAWYPCKREVLPDYVPDVAGGKAAPVALTQWKIQAIKLMILLDRRGVIWRSDLEALKISPSRWLNNHDGWLAKGIGGYIRGRRTPNFRDEHPVNYAQIEADFETWGAKFEMRR